MQGKKYSVVYTEIWYQFLIGNVRHSLLPEEAEDASDDATTRINSS